MDNSSTEKGRALFGTDYHGAERWFCFRKRAGCSGIIATVSKDKPDRSDIFDDEKYLLGPNNWELNIGIYGPYRGRASRSPAFREARDLGQLLLDEAEGLSPETGEYFLAESDLQKRKMQHVRQACNPPNQKQCWIPTSQLPATIICPACKRENVVPSLRDAEAVRKGSVVS